MLTTPFPGLQANKKKAETWGNHLKAVCSWKHKFREFYWAAKSRRDDTNRKVLRVHQRLASEFSKQKEGEVQLRMEALKANDMEAYYEMLSAANAASQGTDGR
eukprot:1195790-Prorocentrum_minimum.AAC.3